MNIIKQLFTSYKKSGWFNSDYKNKNKMGFSIFGNHDDTIGDNNKKYNFLHGVIKYKILVPGMHIFRRMLKGYSLEIDDFFFRNLRVFRDSWDETSEIMSQKYNECFRTHISYKLVKELVILLCKWDTATLEFINVFMHTTTKNMQKEYKGHKRVYHMIYVNRRSYDPIYFNIGQYVMGLENHHPDDAMLKWKQTKRNKFYRMELKKMLLLNKDYKSLKKAVQKFRKEIIDL